MNQLAILTRFILKELKGGKLSKEAALRYLSDLNQPSFSSCIPAAVSKMSASLGRKDEQLDAKQILRYVSLPEFFALLHSLQGEADSEASLSKRTSPTWTNDSNDSTMPNTAMSAISAADKQQYYPLSAAQKSVFVLSRLSSTGTSYNLPKMIAMDSRVDHQMLINACQQLVRRHEALRTSVHIVNGEPVQQVHAEVDFQVRYLEADDDQVERLFREFIIPFQLEVPALFRVCHVVTPNKSFLFIDIHHIVADAMSFKVIEQDLFRLYSGEACAPLRIHYKDFAAWEQRWMSSEDKQRHEEFWLQELAGELPQLNLPLDYARPPLQTYNGDSIKFVIPAELTARLKTIAKESRTTLHMLLLSSYFLFLQQLTGDRDMIVGIPATRRDSEELEQIIGMFINMLCIRIRFDEVSRFDELVNLVKRQSLQAYKHAAYPFETLVAALNPERDLARNAVFQTMFQFYEHIPPENEGVSQFELSMLSREADGSIEIRWEYNTDLFKRDTVACWTRYYAYMLEQLAQNPRLALAEIELLDKQERERLSNMFAAPGLAGELQAGAGTSRDAALQSASADALQWTPGDALLSTSADASLPTAADVLPASIGKWIERHAREQPDAIAVSYGEVCLTYRELNERANRLALLLQQSGARPNLPIALLCGRGIGLIVGLVGIVKSGGCYVPLDPDYPQDRLRRILSHCGSEIIVTEQACGDKLREMYPASDGCAIPHGNSGGPQVVRLDTIGALLGEEQASHTDAYELVAEGDVDPEQLMYIMYTSGSTGMPKGVMVTQRNVANYLAWSIEHFALSQADVMMSVTSASFDISVFEMFGALCSGAKLVIMPSEVVRDPARLLEEMECQGVTVWHSVPTLMSQVLLVAGQGTRSWPCLSNVRQVMLGGEVWSTGLAMDIRRHFRNARITNMYGPTETTIWVSSYDIGEDVGGLRQLPIGRPIAGNEIQILNGHGKRCGIGVPGEIWIEGTNVTPGYYLDPEKTSQAFVRTESGGWRYRTGDAGRYLADGNVEFLGRGEGFVKIRGYRIEPGEIENVLRGKEGITEAVVTVSQETEGDQLACYYTGEAISAEELRSYVLTKLPAYMLPAYFTWLEQMPLTPNGKIDRRAIMKMSSPAVNASRIKEQYRPYEAPANEWERKVVAIWEKVLNKEEISVNDSFFELGGHSLLVIKLQVEMENEGFIVSAIDVHENKTVRRLAAKLKRNSQGEQAVQPDGEIDESKAGREGSFSTAEHVSRNDFVIHHVEPFNELFYKSCFFNSVFPIISAFNKEMLYVLANDVIVYHRDPDVQDEAPLVLAHHEFNPVATKGIRYIAVETMSRLFKEIGMHMKTMPRSENLIQDILSALNNSGLVVVWVDCYYEPIRKDMYQQQHWQHTLLIYGYNEATREFLILEHLEAETLTYDKTTIPFDDLEKAYNGYLEHFRPQAENTTYFEFYNDGDGNINVTPADSLNANLHLHRDQLYSGLTCLHQNLQQFKQIVMSESMLRQYAPSLLSSLNDIINVKKVEQYRTKLLYGDKPSVCAIVDDIMEQWIYIRMIVAKFMYGTPYSESKFMAVIRAFEQVCEREQQHYDMVLHRITADA